MSAHFQFSIMSESEILAYSKKEESKSENENVVPKKTKSVTNTTLLNAPN